MKIKLCSLMLGLCGVFALAARAEETNATASVPQEARRFFVMGVTLFKDAKTPEEFSEAARKFRQAATAAPQWPEARYNLALAEEAAGDYTAANADLKTYLNFKLPAEEAQKVQDTIYTLEAKAEKAARQRAEEQRLAEAKRAEKAKREATMNAFVGEWHRDPVVAREEYLDISWKAESETPHVFYRNRDCTEVKLEGNKLKFVFDVPNAVRQKITITPDGQGKLEAEVSTVWCADVSPGLTDKRTFSRR